MSFVQHIVSPDAAHGPLLYVSLFLGTFVHEGTAIATGAAFLVGAHASTVWTAAALAAGIITGDIGVYGLGALARQSKWLQRRFGMDASRDVQPSFGTRLIPVVAMCRVVPGILFPTFLSYGWRGVPFRRFAVSTVAVTALYVPIVLTLFVQFGLEIGQLMRHWPSLPIIALVTAGTVLTARWLWLRSRRPRSTTSVGPLPAD